MLSGTVGAVVSGVVNLLAYPLYLHFLGYRVFGIWLILSVVITTAQVGNLGLPMAVAKAIANQHGRGDRRGVESCLTNTLFVVLAIATVICGSLLIGRVAILSLLGLHGSERMIAEYLLPSVILLSGGALIVGPLNGSLAGLGRMDLCALTQTTSQLLAVAVNGTLLASGFGLNSLVSGTAASYVFLAVASLWNIRRIAGTRLFVWSHLRLASIRELIGFGSWIFGSSALNLLLMPMAKVLLSRSAGVAVLPLYELTFVASMRVRDFFDAGFKAVMPEVSLAVGRGGHYVTKVGRQVDRATRRGLWVAVVVYSVMFLLADPLLRVWLGGRFDQQLTELFRIMLIATFVSLLCIPAYYKLMGYGYAKTCFVSSAIQSSLNAVMLIGYVAITGTLTLRYAAWSVVISMLVTSTFVILQGYRMTSESRQTARANTDVVRRSLAPPR